MYNKYVANTVVDVRKKRKQHSLFIHKVFKTDTKVKYRVSWYPKSKCFMVTEKWIDRNLWSYGKKNKLAAEETMRLEEQPPEYKNCEGDCNSNAFTKEQMLFGIFMTKSKEDICTIAVNLARRVKDLSREIEAQAAKANGMAQEIEMMTAESIKLTGLFNNEKKASADLEKKYDDERAAFAKTQLKIARLEKICNMAVEGDR